MVRLPALSSLGSMQARTHIGVRRPEDGDEVRKRPDRIHDYGTSVKHILYVVISVSIHLYRCIYIYI